jgi:hypothetical protein
LTVDDGAAAQETNARTQELKASLSGTRTNALAVKRPRQQSTGNRQPPLHRFVAGTPELHRASCVQPDMKRSVIALALLTLTLFTVACATTAPTQTVRGTIASIEGDKLTVTPEAGSPVTVTVGGITRIYRSGVELPSTSVLAAGQNVQVFFEGDRATKVLIGQ